MSSIPTSPLRADTPPPPSFYYNSPKPSLVVLVATRALEAGVLFAAVSSIALGSPLAFVAAPLGLHILAKECGLYSRIHSLIGRLAVPASKPNHPEYLKALKLRNEWTPEKLDLSVERISVMVDNQLVDAVVMGKRDNVNNGRWFLFSNPNEGWYEKAFDPDYHFTKLIQNSDRTALLFNYPGVGQSGGRISRAGMVASHEAMLQLLEKEFKAKNIACYGHSIGGGVQAEAVEDHVFSNEIEYRFVKSRTFTTFSEAVAHKVNRAAAMVMWLTGWNYSCVNDSEKRRQHPELILQTTSGEPYSALDRAEITHDGIIAPKAAAAGALPAAKNRWFMGIPDGHNEGLRDPELVIRAIEGMRH